MHLQAAVDTAYDAVRTAWLALIGLALAAAGVAASTDAVYRWTDASQSHVTCTFAQGRLLHWQLERPAPAADSDES